MAFPDSSESLSTNDPAPPASTQSTSWAANIYNSLRTVITAVKEMATTLVSVKAKQEANTTSLGSKASDDFDNLQLSAGILNLLGGSLAASDIGKAVLVSGTTAVPTFEPGDVSSGVTLGPVILGAWSINFEPSGTSIEHQHESTTSVSGTSITLFTSTDGGYISNIRDFHAICASKA